MEEVKERVKNVNFLFNETWSSNVHFYHNPTSNSPVIYAGYLIEGVCFKFCEEKINAEF